jgi:hypothetical protein
LFQNHEIMIKTLFTCLFFIGLAFLSTAQNVVWEPEMEVADGNTYGYTRPRMALGKNGEPLVLLAKNNGLFFTKWTGTEFSTPIALLPAGMSTYLATWTGPDMEAKGDTIVVVFKAQPYETGHVYTVRSTDGGLTFSDTLRVSFHSGGGLTWMPSMTMDDAGNPLVTYMAHGANSTDPHYVYVKSTDGGATYELEQFITGGVPGEACDCCPSELVAEGDKRVLLYRNNETNIRDIYGVYSKDGGTTFPSSENVDQMNWFIQSCPSTGPHGLLQDTTLYVTYSSGTTGPYRSYVTRSTVKDTIALNERVMLPPPTNTNGVQNFPRIAAEGPLMVVTWAEFETSNFEIFSSFAYNGDLSQLANNKQMVNEITQSTQTNPDIRIKDGLIHIIYQSSFSADVIYRRGYIGFAGLEEQKELPLVAYPNPVQGGEKIFISSNKEQTVNLFSIQGQLVSAEQYVPGQGVSIAKLTPGMYILELTESGQKLNVRVK